MVFFARFWVLKCVYGFCCFVLFRFVCVCVVDFLLCLLALVRCPDVSGSTRPPHRSVRVPSECSPGSRSPSLPQSCLRSSCRHTALSRSPVSPNGTGYTETSFHEPDGVHELNNDTLYKLVFTNNSKIIGTFSMMAMDDFIQYNKNRLNC